MVSCDKNDVFPKLNGAGGGVNPFVIDSRSLKYSHELYHFNTNIIVYDKLP